MGRNVWRKYPFAGITHIIPWDVVNAYPSKVGQGMCDIRRMLFSVFRVLLGFCFIWVGLLKVRQPYDFLSAVYEYDLVGATLGVGVATLLPWVEVVVGCCLVGGVLVSGALLSGALMAAVFVFAQTSALARELDISCGCLRASTADQISYLTLLRAVILAGVTASGYVMVIRDSVREKWLG